jgi:HSP20 family molecular chaperone IbpA
MWIRAQQMLEETDQLWRQFFGLNANEPLASWEPPVDVFETPDDLRIVLALPGVGPHAIDVRLAGNRLVVRAFRDMPFPLNESRILRMELPRGRFERALQLPPGAYHLLEQRLEQGCLLLTFARTRSNP